MPALSPLKKENVGLGGSRMGTKENKNVFMGVLQKKLKHCYSEKYFFLKF
jgi:hypothetical protein